MYIAPTQMMCGMAACFVILESQCRKTKVRLATSYLWNCVYYDVIVTRSRVEVGRNDVVRVGKNDVVQYLHWLETFRAELLSRISLNNSGQLRSSTHVRAHKCNLLLFLALSTRGLLCCRRRFCLFA